MNKKEIKILVDTIKDNLKIVKKDTIDMKIVFEIIGQIIFHH